MKLIVYFLSEEFLEIPKFPCEKYAVRMIYWVVNTLPNIFFQKLQKFPNPKIWHQFCLLTFIQYEQNMELRKMLVKLDKNTKIYIKYRQKDTC